MPQIKLDWSQKKDIGGESYPEDRLDRQKYAEFLTKFLADQGFDDSRDEEDKKQNYVLNLNSEWGSGKTYFLKRWAQDLKQHYPVVYIDAWKQDYSKDPLMTVVSSLIKQLREQAGKPENAPEFAVPRKLIGLFKAAAPALARGLATRYLGIDPVKIMEADDEGDGENSDSELTDEKAKEIKMGFAASEMTKHLIKEHDGKSQAIENLKINVKQWVEAAIGLADKGKSYPAFIFIDELDRCRPSYAVEMLETIKHIFDIKGVVFVVATDTEQLQHAVKAVYGEGFNARTYLSRFFNSRFSLRAPDFKDLLAVHCDKEKLSGAHFDELGITVWPKNEDAQLTLDNITAILNCFGLQAREAIQITERVIAILNNLPEGSKIDILMLTALLSIRENDDELYNEIVTGTFKGGTYDEDVTLIEYLKNRFNLNSYSIKYYVKSISESHSGGLSFNTDNIYKSDTCYYFDKVFLLTFNYTEHSLTPIDKIDRDDRIRSLRGRFDNSRKSTKYGNLWLENLYFDEKIDKITPTVYQDLVELASALDWIDDEE